MVAGAQSSSTALLPMQARPAELESAGDLRGDGGRLELTEVADVTVVILRMSRVSTIDATGASVLSDAIRRLEHRGIAVLVSGVRPGHEAVLDALDVGTHLRESGRIFADTPSAIANARELMPTKRSVNG